MLQETIRHLLSGVLDRHGDSLSTPWILPGCSSGSWESTQRLIQSFSLVRTGSVVWENKTDKEELLLHQIQYLYSAFNMVVANRQNAFQCLMLWIFSWNSCRRRRSFNQGGSRYGYRSHGLQGRSHCILSTISELRILWTTCLMC